MSEQNKNISNLTDKEKKQQVINLLEQALADVTKLRKEVKRLKKQQEEDEFFESSESQL